MEIEKLIIEYENTAKRINNIRATELNLCQELISMIRQQQDEYEELKQSKPKMLGSSELKKRLQEVEEENRKLKDELKVREAAIVSLQKMVQQQNKEKKSKSWFSFLKG